MVSAVFLTFLAASLSFVDAGNLYLYPPKSYAVGVDSLEDASAVISRHLRLDMFEPIHSESNILAVQEDFLGQGSQSSLLLTMNELDAQAVLPADALPVGHVPMPKNVDSLASLASTYLGRAAQTFPSVFETWQLVDTEPLLSFFETAGKPAFAALQVSKLQDLRNAQGSDSEEYQGFAEVIRQFLEVAIHELPNLNVAILTYDSSTIGARQASPRQSQVPFPDHPTPQEPIGAVSACFTTLDSCTNSTNSCSGRGNCVEASKGGRSCFVCACGITTKGDAFSLQTTHWAGQSCERKDISSTFALLSGTVLVLLIVVIGSISLLYTVGDQALPSILLATAVNSKKD